jgi:hypothetical protein
MLHRRETPSVVAIRDFRALWKRRFQFCDGLGFVEQQKKLKNNKQRKEQKQK